LGAAGYCIAGIHLGCSFCVEYIGLALILVAVKEGGIYRERLRKWCDIVWDALIEIVLVGSLSFGVILIELGVGKTSFELLSVSVQCLERL